MSSENENYVWVGAQINRLMRQYSIDCREAVIATVTAYGAPGPSLHVGTFESNSIMVLAEAALSELLSAGVRADIPVEIMRADLVNAARYCGFSEEEEQDALFYDLNEIEDSCAVELEPGVYVDF